MAPNRVLIFAALFVGAFGRARFDIKSNLQSGYAAAQARLQELAQQALKDLAEHEDDQKDADHEAKSAEAEIPPEADEWKAPEQPWIVDAPKLDHIDDISFAFPGDDSHDLHDPPQRATLAWPKDSCPPTLGWPVLLTIPGRKNLRTTMQYIADLLASKGRATFNIDMKNENRIKDINAGIAHLKANNQTYNLNPEDISMFGYSLGAITLNSIYHKEYVAESLSAVIVAAGASFGHLKQQFGKNWGSSSKYGHAPPSLIIHCKDDGLVPWFKKGKSVPEKYVANLKNSDLPAHGLFYDTGCYHHPFKNINFFNEIDLFLTDPEKYESSDDGPEVMDRMKRMLDNFEVISEVAGCADNDEGIVPIRAFEMFNQEQVCRAACWQAEGCVAFDWYTAFPFERPDGSHNCYLYDKACVEPKYTTCSNKQKCPISYKMIQPRSKFSLAQFEAKATPIQVHTQNLRGSVGVGADLTLKRVRTRSMCETDPNDGVSTSNEGQKGLFVILEAADSAGCVFVFSNFGEDCEDHHGVPTDITDALVCEDASARLEGYTYAGEVEEALQDEYPPGCSLKANSGKVKFNPSKMPGVKSSQFALACKVCDSMMAPQDTPLKNYVKLTGDSEAPSYCAGEYDLGKFEYRSNAECAATCDSIEECKHFALCTVPKEDCCQLSSSCTNPYNSSAEWSGFQKRSAPEGAEAMRKYRKSTGQTCTLTEYNLASFDITEAAACAAECEKSNSCTSFVVCKDASATTPCCRLSAKCALPYTHTDTDHVWEAFMRTDAEARAMHADRLFIKTPGHNTENSYCTGAYDLAEYRISNYKECAAKCLANKDCAHFKVCKKSDSVQMCCALSSTCRPPYTSASEEWDGYLNYDKSRFALAADMTPVRTEIEEFLEEPLCSDRTSVIDLKTATLTVNASEGKLKMLWKGVTQVEGEPVDLLVQSVGDDSYTSGTGSSGMNDGTGIINLALGSSVELKFSFQDADEKCVEFDEIHFTPLDINHLYDGHMEEIWDFSDIAGHVVKPFSQVFTEQIGDDLLLKSTSAGFCEDVSVDPSDLKTVTCQTSKGNKTVTYDEDRRAAMIVYKRSCEFRVKLKAPGNPEDFPAGWPFKFVFNSELDQMCS